MISLCCIDLCCVIDLVWVESGLVRVEDDVKLTKSEKRQRESNCIILIRRQKEYTVPQPAPYEHIGNNSRGKMVGVNRHCARPVQGSEIPRQRPANSANVDSARGRRVPEVREGQIEEIDNQQDQGDPVVCADPEVHKAE